ncbi:MAG: transposase [Gammaproteobacteria bacterium (ex Lamellibrachia satsuma)]|nr:MAG: transposase [Gammaproteobacteria bacterium (ex Lamellibrachia satsuma)]
MPRRPRVWLPDQPQHVVVRGHNRDPILARHEDFRFLYRCLLEAEETHGLAVHAWVFMHNHIHLLVTPSDAFSLPRTMQSVGRRYAQYFNRTYHRSGSLWEGRYKSALVDTDRYLLACYRYIELNPVRAGIAAKPEDYPYSSYQANGVGKADGLVTTHPVYLQLISEGSESNRERGVGKTTGAGGLTPTPEEADVGRYVALFAQALDRKLLTEIRRGTEKEVGIGQADFLLRIAGLLSG